ncbi:MAG: hypothetical protein M3069_10895 [Chloroflexota bacterium]|nr:hypothetical protein [Chloroflexota bacterium]
MLGLNSPEGQQRLRQEVETRGQGWLLPPIGWDPLEPGASLRGLGERELDLLRRKAMPQPLATYTQPLRLTHSDSPPSYRRAIVLCDDGKRVIATARASLERGEPYFKAMQGADWELRELDTGHWPMLSQPARRRGSRRGQPARARALARLRARSSTGGCRRVSKSESVAGRSLEGRLHTGLAGL